MDQDLCEKLIVAIRRRPGHAYGRDRLVRRLGIDEITMRQAVDEIRQWGYVVRLTRDKVRFVSAPDLLNQTEVQWHLHGGSLGLPVHAYGSVKSTNDLAAALAVNGATEGTMVIAEQQTKGRGRLGRQWHSPPGLGIYFSLVLRPKIAAEQAPGLSVMTALALAEVLGRLCPGKIQIKWPNDVLLSGKKVAGILTELVAERQRVEHVIVGVGINVNQTKDEFPVQLRDVATSLRHGQRRKQSRIVLLQEFLKSLNTEYRSYLKSGLKPRRRRLLELSSLTGRNVNLTGGEPIREAEVTGIDTQGRLLVMVDGVERAVCSGEVTLSKN